MRRLEVVPSRGLEKTFCPIKSGELQEKKSKKIIQALGIVIEGKKRIIIGKEMYPKSESF